MSNSRAPRVNPAHSAEALDDLGTSRGPEQLERSLKDAQDETRALETDTKSTADAIDREYRDAYRKAKQSADDGLNGMNTRTQEISGELRQNLGETFATFRGDLQDLPQIAQDTLGGLAGSGALGGIPGLAATAAGAAGLGLIIGAFETMNENIEASKERTREWAEAFIEANGRVLEQTQIQTNIAEIANDTDKLARAQGIATSTGMDLADVVAGMADPFGEMGKVLSDSVNTQLDEYREKTQDAADKTGTANAEAMAQNQLYTALSETWRIHNEEVGGGAETYDLYAQAASRAQIANLEAAVATGEATKKVDEFGDSVYTLPDGKQVYVDAETGKATEDIADIEQKIYSVPDANVKVNVDSSAWDNWTPRAKTVYVKAVQAASSAITGLGGETWH